MMQPDQQAAYAAWVNAGATGSPPDWVFVDRDALAKQQANAQAAIAAIQQASLTNPRLLAAFDLTGQVTNESVSIAEPGRTVDAPATPSATIAAPQPVSDPLPTATAATSADPVISLAPPIKNPNPMPAAITLDFSKSNPVYAGSDARGDIYQLYSGTSIYEWAVKPGDNAQNVLAGTLKLLGQDLGQIPGSSGTAILVGDPSHVYVGTDARGDVYQLFDANSNRVLEWAVPVGADSRAILPNTLKDIGPPGPGTVAQAPSGALNQEGAILATTPTAQNPQGAPGAVRTNPAPSPNTLQNSTLTVPAGVNAVQGDPRHVYVGRFGNVDRWQIFDGFNVIQWDVNAGDDSRNAITGSLSNLGPPGANTVAQNNGYVAPPPLAKTNPRVTLAATGTPSAGAAPSSAGTITIVIGVASLLLKAFG